MLHKVFLVSLLFAFILNPGAIQPGTCVYGAVHF